MQLNLPLHLSTQVALITWADCRQQHWYLCKACMRVTVARLAAHLHSMC